MCKEIWVQDYECAIEDLAEEHDVDYEESEKILTKLLDEDPSYLDGYGR